MGTDTKIEWCDSTWNPVRGCSRVSPGCGGPNHEGGCYAEKIAARFSGTGQPYQGFAERTPHGGRWTGKVALVEDTLTLPLRWRKPRRIFVNSMSDLFHEALPDAAIDRVVCCMRPPHTYQVLTKRARRLRDYWRRFLPDGDGFVTRDGKRALECGPADGPIFNAAVWPPPYLWLGVSVERQQEADERIPLLLDTPAATRFLSCEPLLGPIDLTQSCAIWWGKPGPGAGPFDMMRRPLLDWIIVGGESGPGARPMDLAWARSIIAQCKAANVSVFMKQLGSATGFNLHDRKGGNPEEWPVDLRIREFPQ